MMAKLQPNSYRSQAVLCCYCRSLVKMNIKYSTVLMPAIITACLHVHCSLITHRNQFMTISWFALTCTYDQGKAQFTQWLNFLHLRWAKFIPLAVLFSLGKGPCMLLVLDLDLVKFQCLFFVCESVLLFHKQVQQTSVLFLLYMPSTWMTIAIVTHVFA